MSVFDNWTRAYTWLVVVGVAVVALIFVVIAQRGPDQLAARAFANLAAAERLHTKVELALNLPPFLRGEERPFTEMLMRVEGDVQYTESGTPELAGTLYTEAKGRGTIFFADGDARILEDEVRFRLDNLPVFLHRSGSLVDQWTRVSVPLLTTDSPEEAKRALEIVFSSLNEVGDDEIDGVKMVRFTGQLSEEEEDILTAVLQQEVSGNSGLNVLSRLLAANNVESLNVWIEPSLSEVRLIRVHFVRPLKDGGTFDFATLELSFSDFGKDVEIDRPETKLSVDPEVFANLFGEGEVEEAK